MLKPSVPVVAVLVFSSLLFAQHNPNLNTKAGLRPADSNCSFTFTSGHKTSLTQFCVTANGNIAQFSAGSQEFLNLLAPATEGYGICDLTLPPFVPYWDYASDASNNWNPATAVVTPTSVTVTRTTADGIWQLVQTITELKATGGGFGATRISMAITNMSVTDRLISANRHTYIQGNFNDYGTSRISAFGGPAGGSGNALASTTSFVRTKFDFSADLVLTAPGGAGPNPCGPIQGQKEFFEGDGAVEQIFSLDILPGKTKTIAVTYAPF